MKYKTFLLFGAPGAGKGTQGKILGTIPNIYHFACGDVFRNLSIDSDLGRTFISYSSKGSLVPDQPTIQLWRESIDGATKQGRFNPMKDTLDVKAVFNLSCLDMNKLVERLQRRALRENRLDDANLEVIRQRLATYERETKPVLDYYGPTLVHTIDSTQSPINVLQDVLKIISGLSA